MTTFIIPTSAAVIGIGSDFVQIGVGTPYRFVSEGTGVFSPTVMAPGILRTSRSHRHPCLRPDLTFDTAGMSLHPTIRVIAVGRKNFNIEFRQNFGRASIHGDVPVRGYTRDSKLRRLHKPTASPAKGRTSTPVYIASAAGSKNIGGEVIAV